MAKSILYLLECTHPSKQYTRKSEWAFKFRINNHRYRIKSLNHNKLLPVEKHFRLTDYDFNKDIEFTRIEKIEQIYLTLHQH